MKRLRPLEVPSRRAATFSVCDLLARNQMLLVRSPAASLDREKRCVASSGCGSSVAKLVTLEVTQTRRLQGRKPYTSLVISPTSQSHTSLEIELSYLTDL